MDILKKKYRKIYKNITLRCVRKSTMLFDETLFGRAKLCFTIRKAKLFHYANSRAHPRARVPLALLRRGLFSSDVGKLLFAHAQSPSHAATAKLRIPHAVAILATARSRPSGLIPPTPA